MFMCIIIKKEEEKKEFNIFDEETIKNVEKIEKKFLQYPNIIKTLGIIFNKSNFKMKKNLLQCFGSFINYHKHFRIIQSM